MTTGRVKMFAPGNENKRGFGFIRPNTVSSNDRTADVWFSSNSVQGEWEPIAGDHVEYELERNGGLRRGSNDVAIRVVILSDTRQSENAITRVGGD